LFVCDNLRSYRNTEFAREDTILPEIVMGYVRFEVFTAVNMKNGVFWDVTPCGCCRNGRFEGT
jgi:cytidine deaminase